MLLLLACQPAHLSGPTGDPDLTLALTVGEGTFVAYLCGEGARLAETRWFTGAWDDGGTATSDGVALAVVRRDGGFDAELDGAPLDWRARAYGAAILWEASPDGCRTGALLATDGVHGTWCDAAGNRAQVEPVDTVRPGDEILQAFADGRTWTMTPVVP